MNLHFVVTDEEQDVRIDRYLTERCENLSRSYLQKLLKAESVLVNERPVKSSYKVCEGDSICPGCRGTGNSGGGYGSGYSL